MRRSTARDIRAFFGSGGLWAALLVAGLLAYGPASSMLSGALRATTAPMDILNFLPSIALIVFGVGRGVFRVVDVRQLERARTGLCLSCGYDLTGNESGVCPECGTEVERG